MGNVFQGSIKKKYRSSVKAKFHHTKTVFVPGRFHSFTVVAAGGGEETSCAEKNCAARKFSCSAREVTRMCHILVLPQELTPGTSRTATMLLDTVNYLDLV